MIILIIIYVHIRKKSLLDVEGFNESFSWALYELIGSLSYSEWEILF